MTWRRSTPSKYDAAWKLIREGWKLAGTNAVALFERGRSNPYQTRCVDPEVFMAFKRMSGDGGPMFVRERAPRRRRKKTP